MTPLGIAILLCLLLAGGATAASCLIPELTIVGGIWGIPVLGFALLVGVIFRIAVYYDPRVEQSPDAKKYAGYVAGTLLTYLAVFSCLELMFQKEQHIAAILGTVFGILALLSVLAFTGYVWVTKQTPEYPTISQIRRFLLFNSSTLLVIAYFTSQEGLINVMKPFVILFAYTNCVYFAAVYCGIFRDRAIFQSNGTIAERLREWIRSKTQPGKLFLSIQTILTILFFIWLVIEAVCQVPAKFNLVSKGVFAVVAAVSFYTATLYDPRKPSETSRLPRRLFAVFTHLTVVIYLEWYMQNINQKTDPYAFEVHSVTILALVIFRPITNLLMAIGEMPFTMLRLKFRINFFHVTIYTLSTVAYLLFHIVNISSEWKIVALSFANIWYYFTTMYIIAIIAGKYRESVRQEHPVQVPPQVLIGDAINGAINV
jgi:heme/copper-type cytochrome/quinol oxidase subunit 4